MTNYQHRIADQIMDIAKDVREDYLMAREELLQVVTQGASPEVIAGYLMIVAARDWEARVFQVTEELPPDTVDRNEYAQHVFRQCVDKVLSSHPRSTHPMASAFHIERVERAQRRIMEMAEGMDPAFVAALLGRGW